jgi:DNA-binding transcriptional regulator YdaS (Cro superfamily)
MSVQHPVRVAIAASGLNQRQFAEKLKISRQTLTNWLTHGPPAKRAIEIERISGGKVSIRDCLEWRADPEPMPAINCPKCGFLIGLGRGADATGPQRTLDKSPAPA